MTQDIVIIGCGGHGREMVGVIDAVNRAAGRRLWTIVGFLDDGPSAEDLERLQRIDVPFLGTVEDRAAELGDVGVVIGIGSGAARERVADRIAGTDLRPVTVVHPTATIGRDCEIGEGSMLLAGAQVGTNVRLGRHVIASYHSVVGHDSRVGDFSTVSGLTIVGGGSIVGRRVDVFVSSALVPQVRVGDDAVVAAGACVVRDVPAGTTVRGVPAR